MLMRSIRVSNHLRHSLLIPYVGLGKSFVRFGSTSTALNSDLTETQACFRYSEISNKAYIKIIGPEAPKFLNGLVTAKLLPKFVKKNLTTISPNSDTLKELGNGEIVRFDESHDNWGIYNEVSANGPYISRFGVYTGLLNSKGKLITDTIIYPTPLIFDKTPVGGKNYPIYLLEFDNSIVDDVLEIFDIHKLNSKIKYKKLKASNYKVWDISIKLPKVSQTSPNPWVENIHEPISTSKTSDISNQLSESMMRFLFQGEVIDSILACYIDKRFELLQDKDSNSPQLLRIITNSDINDISEHFNFNSFPFPFKIENVSPNEFRSYRLKNGIIDSVRDFRSETIWPLELNFDFFLNSVNPDKGCYLGQEITTRMFSTGILRKRLIPVKLENYQNLKDNEDTATNYYDITLQTPISVKNEATEINNPFSNQAFSRRQRPIGTLICNEGENGVAIIRTEYLNSIFKNQGNLNNNMFIRIESKISDSETKTIKVIPRKPFWYETWEEKN
ncbi:hypothetical protein Kpol_1008p9 [Vanderwaltozyma polyspora DSM 70294]|uniref:Uncharacterized protein n=1 Tax=Vanderwaltozyma polyspora (strain ATCC 22028 / DSM 70294 / BCRC 21397 / CBS 2163 / NBRC 10782 / NRRL Y-8283 / UCD 57-17) TaxID=436907 RepID=A7TPX4_VANPO|nr:uncharacterized protein Kpol_1008p9 [Vanderwaltozyma polyspora DSM 70294]EDO15672.1 hypothetical protein Kpol_1008p9 [Vanderwaltozyma polyspora DSM 70294]